MSCPVCESSESSVSRVSIAASLVGLPSGTLHGVERIECDDCGEASYSVPAHNAVVREYRKQLAGLSRDLTNSEFAFLRRSLGLSGKAYAEALEVSNVTISRIENGESIPALQQAMMRAVTMLDLMSVDALQQFVTRDGTEAHVDVVAVERSLAREVSNGWQELQTRPLPSPGNVVQFPRSPARQIDAMEFEEEESSISYRRVAACR